MPATNIARLSSVKLIPVTFNDRFIPHRKHHLSISYFSSLMFGDAMGWSLFQGSPTECGVSECDREASPMRRPRPTGFRATGGKNV
jgi:hypothetical protein